MPMGKGGGMWQTGLFKIEIKLIKLIKWEIQKFMLLRLLFIHRWEWKDESFPIFSIPNPLPLNLKYINPKKKQLSVSTEDGIVI